LIGAWYTTRGSDGRPLPCPLIIEFFPDGTVETNYLSDDSDAERCGFLRLSFTERVDTEPRELGIGGQLNACIYAREGDALRLACEDHSRAPRDFSTSLLLKPLDEPVGSGLPDLVGEWLMSSPYGAAGRVVIHADGKVDWIGTADAAGSIAVVDDDHLELRLEGSSVFSTRNGGGLHCRYRVTRRRLALRCMEPPNWPADFRPPASDGGISAFVLRRPTPDEDAALARAEPPPERHPDHRTRGDGDGDGLANDVDRCAEAPEDFDRFEDTDGCPDSDNDRDGVPDESDACPQLPEVRDGIDDADGCPDEGT
jgi:hypothetical protein